MNIEIDNESGFCFGVTTAIQKAEEELDKGGIMYCLGDIVHNDMEVRRLHNRGMVTINHEKLDMLPSHSKVLLRAHGEPPATYRKAEERDIEIIDATCPVVLQLQRRIKRQYTATPDAQIVIFGKKGHAEVLGLVGQTEGHAIVIEHMEDCSKIDLTHDVYLYSQTTKNLDEYHRVIAYLKEHISPEAEFHSFDTICRQVANRMHNIAEFAARHDLVLFVCGHKSSNGKVLFNQCLSVNPNTHLIESPDEIQPAWLTGITSVGICGATSTPKWLMEDCKSETVEKISSLPPSSGHV